MVENKTQMQNVLIGGYLVAPAVFALICYIMTTPLVSVLPHQQLVRKVDDFMPEYEFERMKQCLSDHPLTGKTILDDKAEELETSQRARIEGAIRGLELRASGPERL